MKQNLKYFNFSFLTALVGLVMSFFLGHYYGGLEQAYQFVFLCLVLIVLEVSISFDNAVVNATVLHKMTPEWQHRFLTWGILIAVFGMRLVFPLAIVAVVAHMNPWEALVLAAQKPNDYMNIMLSVHHEIAAYGGSFLMLVALKYFFDSEKDVHWVRVIEAPLSKIGRLEAAEVGFVILFTLIFSSYLPPEHQLSFLKAGGAGILTYLFVEAIGTFLKGPGDDKSVDPTKASIGMFLYLEVLDASFSFDGVIGAFALTNNLFLIAIGLGVGAFFVRSLTVFMVEKGTLQAFQYLEHGAFYAVGFLSLMMFLDTIVHVPEAVTGLVGAVMIGLSIYSSIRYQKRHEGKTAVS